MIASLLKKLILSLLIFLIFPQSVSAVSCSMDFWRGDYGLHNSNYKTIGAWFSGIHFNGTLSCNPPNPLSPNNYCIGWKVNSGTCGQADGSFMWTGLMDWNFTAPAGGGTICVTSWVRERSGGVCLNNTSIYPNTGTLPLWSPSHSIQSLMVAISSDAVNTYLDYYVKLSGNAFSGEYAELRKSSGGGFCGPKELGAGKDFSCRKTIPKGADTSPYTGIDLCVVVADNRNSSNCIKPIVNPIVCNATFIPSSGTLVQGNTFDFQGKVNSVSGGNGTGIFYQWVVQDYGPSFVYPPTVDPTALGVFVPGRWNPISLNPGNYTVTFVARNGNEGWNQGVFCSGGASMTITPGVSPIGNFGSADCTEFKGWAGDKDNPNLPINVRFTAQKNGTGPVIDFGPVVADDPRLVGICDALGGQNCALCTCSSNCPVNYPVQCKHGFHLDTPASIKDGSNYSIIPYGINLPGTTGGETLLTPSPKTINCSAPNLPWFQVQGGDVHAEGNITSLIPATAVNKAFNLDYPGVVSFTGSVNFNSANVSSTNWLANSSNLSSFSYASYYQKFGSPTANTFNCSNNGQCPANLPSGIYYSDSSQNPLQIQKAWSIPSTSKVIVLVDSDLQIDNTISVPVGGFLAFIVKGNINIKGTVGDKSSGSFTGTNAHLQGVFITDQQINTKYDNDNSGNRLVGAGVFYAKTGFLLRRDLKDSGSIYNSDYPAELFISRPDLIINAPSTLFSSSFSWQEVAP